MIQLPGRPLYRLVEMPIRDVTEDVTDDDLVRLCSDAWRNHLHDKTEPDYSEPGVSQPSNPITSAESETGSEQSTAGQNTEKPGETGEIQVSSDARELLKDIAANPFKGVTDRYDLFLSTGKGYQVKTGLLETGLVEEVEVTDQTYDPSKTYTFFDLTDAGRQYLKQNQITLEWTGRGGIEHLYWQNRIKELLEAAGFTAEVEVMDIDVYGKHGETEVAVEVARGKNQRELDHVVDRLENDFAVVVACNGVDVKQYISEKVDGLE